MSFDIVAMNLNGFLFYSIYNTEGYFIDNKKTRQVDRNGVFFACHAMFTLGIIVIILDFMFIAHIVPTPKKKQPKESFLEE